MNYEQLLALIGDNAEAKTFIASIQQTSKDNTDKINTLERKAGEFKTSLDKFKLGNTLIKTSLGIDTLNEETLNEALSNLKGGKGDEKLTAEIANLKTLLETANSDKTTQSNEYESKLQTMALDNAISNSSVGANVANEAMFGIVKNLIKDGATYENGEIVYKNSDGTTAFSGSGKPMNINDKISALKSDANYAGLFKPDANGGSGTPPQNNGGSTGLKRGSMNHSEKGKYIAEHGQDAYLALPAK